MQPEQFNKYLIRNKMFLNKLRKNIQKKIFLKTYGSVYNNTLVNLNLLSQMAKELLNILMDLIPGTSSIARCHCHGRAISSKPIENNQRRDAVITCGYESKQKEQRRGIFNGD